MNEDIYVGLDAHKDNIDVAIAESPRGAEVRYWGTVESSSAVLDRLLNRLIDKYIRIVFCYEAGPCRYWICR